MGLLNRLRGKRTPAEAFSDEIAKLARDLIGVERAVRGPDFSLALTHPDGMSTVMYLATVFAEASLLEGTDRDERLRQAVLAMRPTARPATWEEAVPRLLPAVRAASWVAAAVGTENELLRRPFLPFLLDLAAIDDQHGMTFATVDDLATWEVHPELVTSVAVENLLRCEMPVGQPRDEPGWLEVLGPDGFASSWLVAPEVLEELGGHIEGATGFVALAPSRDILRLVSTTDAGVLGQHLGWALEAYDQAPRPLSPVPYCVRDGALAPWQPPDDHPARRIVDAAQRHLAAGEYTQQEAVLNDLYERAGEKIFISHYGLVREPRGGPVWSWSVWVKQEPVCLLPRTDYILLGDTELAESICVRWEDAEVVAAGCLQPEPGYFPPRWRVEGWPDETVFEALRLLAVDLPEY